MKTILRRSRLCGLVILCVAAGCQRPPTPAPSQSEQPTKPRAASSGQTADPAPAQVNSEGLPKTVDGRVVLATAPATADSKRQYEVSIGACVKKECPVLISLLEAGKVLDQARAEWSSATREPVKEDVMLGWGVGDPAGPSSAVTAWRTGEEEGYLGIAIRIVRLSPEMNGLLIDQRSGFEHIKRHHELFIHQDGKVRRAWSASEGAGPVWTSTTVIPVSEGQEAVVFFEGFRYPLADQPDTMKAAVLQWDTAGRKLAARAPTAPLQAAVIRGFESIDAARKAKAAQRDCLGAFWVLPARAVDKAAKTGFVLAMPSVDREKALASAQCAQDRKPEVLSLNVN